MEGVTRPGGSPLQQQKWRGDRKCVWAKGSPLCLGHKEIEAGKMKGESHCRGPRLQKGQGQEAGREEYLRQRSRVGDRDGNRS